MFSLRYSRESALPMIGIAGLEKIMNSRISVIGVGATGSAALDLFARNGAREIRIADPDTVDISNLHRQSLYSESDIGTHKVEAAKRRISQINSKILVSAFPVRADSSNITEITDGVSIIIDGTDNMASRKLINDFSIKTGIPWVFSSAIGSTGQVKIIIPGKTACLGCLGIDYSSPDVRCEDTGVLASAPYIVGNLAWTLAVRYILGSELEDAIYSIDVLNMDIAKVRTVMNPQCYSCGSVFK